MNWTVTTFSFYFPCQILRETVNLLPNKIKQIIEHIEQPHDNRKKLIDALTTGLLIGACDGWLQQNEEGKVGGYGFSLQTWDHDRQRIIRKGPTPKSNDMASLLLEIYGILGTVIMAFILHLHCERDIPRNKMALDFYLDNKEATSRSMNKPDPLNVLEHLKTECNFMILI